MKIKKKIKDYMVKDPLTGLPTTQRVLAGKTQAEGAESGGHTRPALGGYVEGSMPEILRRSDTQQ